MSSSQRGSIINRERKYDRQSVRSILKNVSSGRLPLRPGDMLMHKKQGIVIFIVACENILQDSQFITCDLIFSAQDLTMKKDDKSYRTFGTVKIDLPNIDEWEIYRL